MGVPQALFSFLGSAVVPQFGINWLDIIIVLVFVVYSIEGYIVGFVSALFDLLSFVLSFIVGLKFYALLGNFLFAHFTIAQGFANALGFFILAFISEIIFNVVFRQLYMYLVRRYSEQETVKKLSYANKVLGIIPGALSALIILSFLLTLIISLPLSPFLKKAITSSRLGNSLVAHAQISEKNINAVFGGAIKDTLDFLTVEPKSDESVSLHFHTTQVSPDETAEQYMLTLVNQERTSRGISPLVFDTALRDVGRAHSADMFTRGYFSHYTPEGHDPFDRMAEANITYQYAGENLALAPNTDLAMQGLMNSPGHKANILNPHFKKVGIGIIDGGVYGEMFSQEFTD